MPSDRPRLARVRGRLPFAALLAGSSRAPWDDDPAWSPDAGRAPSRGPTDTVGQIYVMDADGSGGRGALFVIDASGRGPVRFIAAGPYVDNRVWKPIP